VTTKLDDNQSFCRIKDSGGGLAQVEIAYQYNANEVAGISFIHWNTAMSSSQYLPHRLPLIKKPNTDKQTYMICKMMLPWRKQKQKNKKTKKTSKISILIIISLQILVGFCYSQLENIFDSS